jgi:hypothetical protein
MGNILAALFDWISAVFRKLWKFIEDNFMVILICVAIWYAPALATYFETTVPWLSSAFSWIGTTIQPLLVDAVGFVTGPFVEGGFLHNLFVSEATGLGVKALLTIGGMYLLAPEEASTVVEAVAEFTGEIVGDIASSFVTGLTGGSLGKTLAIVGATLFGFWFLTSSSDDDDDTAYISGGGSNG